MEKSRSIEIILGKISQIDELRMMPRNCPQFVKWKRDTEVALEKVFGTESRHATDFTKIKYSLSIFSTSTPDSAFQDAYVRGLQKAKAILESIVDEIREFEVHSNLDVAEDFIPDAFSMVERVCLRFHSIARQLRSRHASRPTLEIDDEYDAQDLFHALLKMHFDDVREEEWTPSYAGGAARADLHLKEEKIFVELKKTRQGLTPKILGEQLIVDIVKYANHPDCRALICFVYDPEGRIGNPVGIEKDLERIETPLKIRVIIAPKGT